MKSLPALRSQCVDMIKTMDLHLSSQAEFVIGSDKTLLGISIATLTLPQQAAVSFQIDNSGYTRYKKCWTYQVLMGAFLARLIEIYDEGALLSYHTWKNEFPENEIQQWPPCGLTMDLFPNQTSYHHITRCLRGQRSVCIYRKIRIRCTKSQNLIVSRLVLQLSLSNPMKPGVKSSMKM